MNRLLDAISRAFRKHTPQCKEKSFLAEYLEEYLEAARIEAELEKELILLQYEADVLKDLAKRHL